MDEFELSADEADGFWAWLKSSGELAALTAWLAAQPKSEELPGRNEPCPCGSGRKFKKCCGR
jgi:uncharacterized protein YecA (UPF0149 family)